MPTMPPKKRTTSAVPAAVNDNADMPEQKKAKTEHGSPILPLVDQQSVNLGYLNCVLKDLAIVLEEWPNISQWKPLPLAGTSGHNGLTGFASPFDPAAYDANFIQDNFEYSCNFNFFWQDMVNSVLHYVPLYWDRVEAYAEMQVGPAGAQLRYTTTVVATSVHGTDVEKGGLLRLSPCEPVHGVLHKVALVLAGNPTQSEKNLWLRTLLSAPCQLKKMATADAKFAEANSLRQDADTVSRIVVFSARQQIHTVWNFKQQKEAQLKTKFGSRLISKFFHEQVRGAIQLSNTSNVDTCITVRDRMFSQPGCENIVVWFDKKSGRDSPFNSLNKLQEVVYRCNKGPKMYWFMRSMQDAVESGKVTAGDISNAAIKTGTRSMSDVCLTGLAMKRYLLGEWLDQKAYPPYVKAKCREIFDTHDSWRLLWHPLDYQAAVSALDVTWSLSWPKAFKDLLDFLESAIYIQNGREEYSYRQAVKNNCTPAEILTQSPWASVMQELNDGLTATVVSAVVDDDENNGNDGNTPSEAANQKTNDGDKPADAATSDHELQHHLQQNSELLCNAVHAMIARQTSWIQDVGSVPALVAAFEQQPLAMIQPGDSGMVMVLVDLNVFGAVDVQNGKRVCPVSADKLDTPLRALLLARQKTDNPEKLEEKVLYVCFSGGKDRERIFKKPLKTSNQKSGRDKDRTTMKRTTLHITEQSWRERFCRPKGDAHLTQMIYFVANHKTFNNIKHTKFPTHEGSTRSNVMGPIKLDPAIDLPVIDASNIKNYFGKRFVLAGGRAPDADDDESESSDDEVEPQKAEPHEDNSSAKKDKKDKPSTVPIAPHALPVSCVMDIMIAHGVKHVIDLFPTPMGLAFQVIANGGSYVALCASPDMQFRLKKELFDQLIMGLVDPNCKLLYDARFSKEAAEAGC